MAGKQGRAGHITLAALSLVAVATVALAATRKGPTPPAPAAQTAAAPPSPEHVREERVLDEMKNVPITIYSASYCPWCRKAKDWMDGSGIAYTERRVDQDPQAKADMKRLGRGDGIPTFDIEGEVRSGYDPAWVEATLRTHAERRLASR